MDDQTPARQRQKPETAASPTAPPAPQKSSAGPPAELHADLPDSVRVGSFSSERHTTSYLAAGDPDAPVVLLTHGWPEFGRSWVKLMEPLAAHGYHAIAPDMRGYGASTVHPDTADYQIAEAVQDMTELLAHLRVGPDNPAVVVGHDYGSPVAWNLATHHPELLAGIVGISVPHLPPGAALTDHIDRSIYPADEYRYGQWDYLIAHLTMADQLAKEFDSDVPGFIASIMRAGSARAMTKPAPNASVRARGGWFPTGMPSHEPDSRVLEDSEYRALVAALQHTGFTAANSWYRNNEDNAAYAADSPTDGRITVPALFVHARYDIVCSTLTTTLADPMRESTDDLSEAVVDSGHWIAHEKPAELFAVIAPWLTKHLTPQG